MPWNKHACAPILTDHFVLPHLCVFAKSVALVFLFHMMIEQIYLCYPFQNKLTPLSRSKRIYIV